MSLLKSTARKCIERFPHMKARVVAKVWSNPRAVDHPEMVQWGDVVALEAQALHALAGRRSVAPTVASWWLCRYCGVLHWRQSNFCLHDLHSQDVNVGNFIEAGLRSLHKDP